MYIIIVVVLPYCGRTMDAMTNERNKTMFIVGRHKFGIYKIPTLKCY